MGLSEAEGVYSLAVHSRSSADPTKNEKLFAVWVGSAPPLLSSHYCPRRRPVPNVITRIVVVSRKRGCLQICRRDLRAQPGFEGADITAALCFGGPHKVVRDRLNLEFGVIERCDKRAFFQLVGG